MKVGNYVICVENFASPLIASPLIIGKKYLVIDIDVENEWIDIEIMDQLNNPIKISFSLTRFISIEQHRENQLNKIM
jgi:hypothetical protein